MATLQIHKRAAAAQLHPREWLLQALNEHGSRSKLAAELKVSPNAISRALCEFQIMELKYYGYHNEVVREWMREEDLLRCREWQ